jgi:hypothetical protein
MLATDSTSTWGGFVAAVHCCAGSEDGDQIDDPSEGALFMLISELNGTDSTFVVVQPYEDGPAWLASVAVLDGDGCEIVWRDTARCGPGIIIRTHQIAGSLT